MYCVAKICFTNMDYRKSSFKPPTVGGGGGGGALLFQGRFRVGVIESGSLLEKGDLIN